MGGIKIEMGGGEFSAKPKAVFLRDLGEKNFCQNFFQWFLENISKRRRSDGSGKRLNLFFADGWDLAVP